MASTPGLIPFLSSLLPKLRSVRVRAFLVVLAVLAIPLFAVMAFSYFEQSIGEKMLSQVRGGAETTAAVLRQGGPAPIPEGADLVKAIDAIAHQWRVRIRVLDASGTVLIDAHREAQSDLWKTLNNVWYGKHGVPSLDAYDHTLGPMTDRTEFLEAKALGRSADCRTAGGEQLVCHAVVALPAAPSPTDPAVTLPMRVIYAQDSIPRAITTLSDQRRQLAALTLAILPLALALGWWLGWRFVRPIEQLREQLLARAATAAPRADVDVGREDEFGDLTQAFNLLLQALHDRRKANEAFVADLAHEFKNPVAAIRAAAEALSDGKPQLDAARAQRLASLLKDSSRRLDALLSQFLELARAEAGMPNEGRAAVDLDPLIRGIVDSFAKDDRWKAIRFQVDSNGARLYGVPERLESAIRNVIDNAVSFARGEVRVTSAAEGGQVIIRVADDGPGISPEDLPRVFDRFFTSRRLQGGGTGLGLALTRAVVEGHGGTVAALSNPGEGAVFELRLPREGLSREPRTNGSQAAAPGS